MERKLLIMANQKLIKFMKLEPHKQLLFVPEFE